MMYNKGKIFWQCWLPRKSSIVYTIPRHIKPETMTLALGLRVSDVLGTSNFHTYIHIQYIYMCVCLSMCVCVSVCVLVPCLSIYVCVVKKDRAAGELSCICRLINHHIDRPVWCLNPKCKKGILLLNYSLPHSLIWGFVIELSIWLVPYSLFTQENRRNYELLAVRQWVAQTITPTSILSGTYQYQTF